MIVLRCSQLAKYELCPMYAKISSTNQSTGYTGTYSKAMEYGNKLHYIYSFPFKSFDRQLCRYRLNMRSSDRHGNFEKMIGEDIKVRGKYDDLRVLLDPVRQLKYVSLLEVKTTSKNRLCVREQRSAVFQLQLYIWLLKDHLDYLGYKLNKNHYVEVFSQKTGDMMMRIQVHEDPNIEDKIKYIIGVFQGIQPMIVPPYGICKICPNNIKSSCNWYAMRKVIP